MICWIAENLAGLRQHILYKVRNMFFLNYIKIVIEGPVITEKSLNENALNRLLISWDSRQNMFVFIW